MRKAPNGEETSGAFGIGLAMCICVATGIIPVIGLFTGIASLVLWIIYWIKVAGFNRQLRALA